VFNIENTLCALSILLVNGVESQSLFKQLPKLKSVAGRMQVLAKSPTIILDFAHTPDALQQVLLAIKAHLTESTGKLIVLFGCGGNRDQGKRPLMGQIAESLADEVVLTSDNPRDENPEQILMDIEEGLQNPELVHKEVDREKAILELLATVTAEDIVVIAGKGHEQYQEINGKKWPYSDQAVVQKWLEQKQKNQG
ncbi:MAG: cyanophycin synthetase, partial [Thiomicrorhabdus sp.]|nr:cyanophycin synthetase [Thiomicrorhabdus sp.]